MKTLAAIAVVALLGFATNASAVILTGGPVYTLPMGGSCVATGLACQTGGATVTCTGLDLTKHTNVYFGIKNNANVNGNTMTGSAPAASSSAVFKYKSETANSITYESTTPVTSQLVLTRVSGSAPIVATGGNPANDAARGDIQSFFKITGGTSFTIKVEVKASNSFHALGAACNAVYDPTHTPTSGSSDFSKVDLAFYYSDCGDNQKDSPEDCDLGGGNGSASTCCNSDCTFRAGGQVCRTGSGDDCDTTETCTGSAADCPQDDAPINSGNVCRMGSGDICDQNETCDGVPGHTCPPDDAPGNTTVICRASTTGDICDEDEFCTGVAGQTCPPDDAPGKINVVCRNGSGDICDPDEKCTGVPGQACPPDVVANPTTVCRTGSGDVCDPNELCTAIPMQPCPPDVVKASGFVCRAAAGVCDVEEQCTGSASQACPGNSFVSAGTSCNEDADVCTVDQCDGAGNCAFNNDLECDDSNSCTQDTCDATDGCQYDGAPSLSCLPAAKAVFKYKNKDPDARDGVRFVWTGGPSIVEDMGNPTQTTRYELCVYDATGAQLAMGVPPGGPWETVGQPASPKGYKYKDKSASVQGIKLIKTKASSLPKAKLKVAGKGDAMPDSAVLPFQFPVTAQLYASDGECWEAQFDQLETRKNDETGFTGKVSAP